jgi:hypothetical protein
VAYRIDRGTLRPPQELPDGRLRADGYLTRSGVFLYRNGDGTIRREYRPPEEVFHVDSLKSFEMVPVTDDHPPVMLNAANAAQYTRGMTGEQIRQDDRFVAGGLTVFDAKLVEKVKSGKVELSCAYQLDIDDTPGVTPEGERYDCVQRNIRGNHVAVVKSGRAGPEARIRMDAAIMLGDDDEHEDTDMNFEQMKAALEKATLELAQEKARADSATRERDEAQKQRDQAQVQAQAEKQRADKAEGERDAQKARADAAEKARTDSSIEPQVRARVMLETKASPVLGGDFKFKREDGSEVDVAAMTDREIKLAVVKRIDNEDVPKDKSDDYVTARYDSAIARAQRADASVDRARLVTGSTGSAGDTEAVARQKMIEHNRNAYKTDAAKT